MTTIDWQTLINWLVSGFVGFIFGIGSSWVTYRYERKRDDIAWEREKEKLKQQFQHEKEVLEAEFSQKLVAIKEQERASAEKRLAEIQSQKQAEIRASILGRDIINYSQAVHEMAELLQHLRDQGYLVATEPVSIPFDPNRIGEVAFQLKGDVAVLEKSVKDYIRSWEEMSRAIEKIRNDIANAHLAIRDNQGRTAVDNLQYLQGRLDALDRFSSRIQKTLRQVL
ncbi:hypothetical protein D6779_02780 [Candidatus Parcubacteria bacterium]|nr:MAG: hypothetical protein D6779_02780 [Candidatus Parcubacteria bacterium]